MERRSHPEAILDLDLAAIAQRKKLVEPFLGGGSSNTLRFAYEDLRGLVLAGGRGRQSATAAARHAMRDRRDSGRHVFGQAMGGNSMTHDPIRN